MTIKTFYAMSARKLDEQVNQFLSRSDVNVIDLRYQASTFYFSVMVMYEPG